MPFGILYVLSDIIYIMVFHVARYRRKVVEKNLAVSFPDMDEDLLRKVEKQFYRNFADYIVETIKLMRISDRQMASRMTFDGIEHINNTVGKGRSVVCFFLALRQLGMGDFNHTPLQGRNGKRRTLLPGVPSAP